MEAGFLQDLVHRAVDCLERRIPPDWDKSELSAFLKTPLGVAALRRANAVLWIAFELASSAETSTLASEDGTPLHFASAQAAALRVTLGRLLPDALAVAEIAELRANGTLGLPAEASSSDETRSASDTVVTSRPESPGVLLTWLRQPANTDLTAQLFAVLIAAECRNAVDVPELSVHPLVQDRLERALTELSRSLTDEQQLDPISVMDAATASSREAPGQRLDEDVLFTVYKPRSVAPGTWTRLLAFAHLAENPADAPPGTKDPRERVREQAEALLGTDLRNYEPRAEDAGSSIPREGELTFVPAVDGVEFNPPYVTFIWLGEIERAEFKLRAGTEHAGKILRGHLRVLCGSLLLAELNLSLRVDFASSRTTPAKMELADSARPYRKIFASYSHADRQIVEHVSAFAKATGDQYLIDFVSLRSGEEWAPAIERLIREADVFQLFWSEHAMRSEMVEREWRYALSLGRPGFVRPTYWQIPMAEGPGLPPGELRALHFCCIALPCPQAASPSLAASPSPPEVAADLRPGLGVLSGLATGSAAVLLTLHAGALDRTTSSAERLSEAAGRVLGRTAIPTAPPKRAHTTALHELRQELRPVPELSAEGFAPALFLILAVLALLERRPRRTS